MTTTTPRQVFCTKLKGLKPGLEAPPMPGELGNRIYGQICKEAWQMWLQHQTMLINEYRLSMIDPKSRSFLLQEMESFLFGDGSDRPPGYVKPT